MPSWRCRWQMAFDEQARSGDIDAHRGWIRRLLEEYYDPMYAYQLSQRSGERCASAIARTLMAYLRSERLDAHG
jgi:tRNA 2-selenouridine synthase